MSVRTDHTDDTDESTTALQRDLSRRTYLKAVALAAGGSAFAAPASADDDGDTFDGEEFAELICDNTEVFVLFGAGAFFAAEGACYLSGVGDGDKIDADDALELQAENIEAEIDFNAVQSDAMADGFLTQAENHIQPGNWERGGYYNQGFSIIKRTLLEQRAAENTVSEGQQQAKDELRDYSSTTWKNYINQNSTHHDDIVYYYHIAADHAEMDAKDAYHCVTAESAADWPDNVSFSRNWGENGLTDLSEFELPNGETVDLYAWDAASNYVADFSREYWFDASMDPELFSSDYWQDGEDYYGIASPGDVPWINTYRWMQLLDTLNDIHDQLMSDVDSLAEEIWQHIDPEEIDPAELLDGREFMVEFGDSLGIDRVTAELLAMGYEAPADLGSTVEIVVDGEVRTGHLFLRWDFSTLAAAQYEFDPDTQTVDVVHVDPSATYTFENPVGDTNEVTADEFTTYDGDEGRPFDGGGDGRTPGYYEFDHGEEDDWAEIEAVTIDREGDVSSWLPAGADLDDDEYAAGILVYQDDDDEFARREFLTGPFELRSIEDADGHELDYLLLDGWINHSNDGSMALDEVEQYADTRESIEVLIEDDSDPIGIPIPDGGSVGNALLGLGIIALLGLGVALWVLNKVTKLHPARW